MKIENQKTPVNGSSKLTIDPAQHSEALRYFLAHFGLIARKPDLSFLQRISHAFSHLPYENISKIIKLNQNFISPARIRLPEEVMNDHVRYHLGGTCFSLSYFLHSILTQLGYDNCIIMANMGQRTNVHCALIVDIEKKRYLVDPGYLLTQTMELDKDKTRLYRSPHAGVEVMFSQTEERFHLSTFDQQVIKLRYTFADRATPMDEFLQHWHASFYHGTMHGICLTQVRDDGMIYVHDNYVQIATISGKKKQKIKENYQQVIAEIFSIDPMLVEAAKSAIAANMEMEKIHGLFRPKQIVEV